MRIHSYYKYLKKERLWKGLIAFGKVYLYIYSANSRTQKLELNRIHIACANSD